VLSERELAAIWHATAIMGDFGRCVRLMMLTGARRAEIGGLKWEEVVHDPAAPRIKLPAARCKNRRPHVIALSPLALAQLPSPRSGYPHLFGRVQGAGFDGWARKTDLDAKLIGMEEPWQLRDLRRTFSTHANERGLALPHIIEACINHMSGHKAGVAGTYNRAAYADEKRAAFEAWGSHVGRSFREERRDQDAVQATLTPVGSDVLGRA
jgi:integrase